VRENSERVICVGNSYFSYYNVSVYRSSRGRRYAKRLGAKTS